jgi:hypothetical protein
MPRLHGVRERRHQPIWDTLIRTTGDPSPQLQALNKLFGNANVGRLELTNLQVAGQLAADQIYVMLAFRCWLFFDGTNRRALYTRVSSQLYFTYNLGDKPQFQAPCWYYPAGGGIYGFDTDDSVLNNGEPSHEAILKLARPIVIPVRQNISVDAQFFAVGSINVLTTLNAGATDDQKVILFMIDGL